DTDVVVHLDLAEHAGHIADGDAREDARRHEALVAAQPREAVGTELAHQRSDLGAARDPCPRRDRLQLDGSHVAVAVMIWTAPPMSVRRCTSAKPADRTRSSNAAGGGR